MARLLDVLAKPFELAISFFMKFDDISHEDILLYRVCYSVVLMAVAAIPLLLAYFYFGSMSIAIAWAVFLCAAMFMAVGWGSVMEPWVNVE